MPDDSESARRRTGRADDPRRQAIRASLDAVKAGTAAGAEEVRAALSQELSARGVTDIKTDELDLLVQLVVAPRRAGARLIVRQLKHVAGGLGMLLELVRTADPRWTYAPDGTPSMLTWRSDQEEVPVDLPTRELTAARDVLVRLFADLHHSPVTEQGSEEVRPFECWLSWDPANGPDSPVTVNIGTYLITELSGDHANLARQLISAHGGDRHAIEIVAKAHGQNVDTGMLRLSLLDRP